MVHRRSQTFIASEAQMSVVSTEKLWDELRREKAEAEQQFLSFPPFTMDPKKGLFITVEKRRGKEVWHEDVWLSAPFEIIGRVRDPHSHGWARLLQWKDDDDVIHQHPVADQDLHGDGAALCASLANAGLKIVTGGIRQHFVSYLNSAIVKARVTIVPRTGWHNVNDKRIFALPGEGSGIDGTVILAVEVTASHYASSGTLADWQGSVAKMAAAHSRARFAIASAFVSPLLALIGADGGGINMQGPSSIGKTTLLSSAASVWGRGDEVGNVVYSIAGGIGKQRANRDGSAKLPSTWRIFVLSTGEISISDKIKEGGKRARAGQEIRILDLSADAGKGFGVFDTGDNPEQLARDLRQAAITFYGTAGLAFIRAIIAQVNDVTIIAQESLDAFREQVAANVQSGQVLRAANRLGLVSVAGELAIQLGILPWPTGSINEAAAGIFRAWHVARGGNDPAEVRAAIDLIRGILERYGDSRFDPPNLAADSRPVPDRLGYIQGEGADRQWWVLPRTWRNTFCEGFDAKDVAKALVERGLLLPGYGNETNRPVRINGQLTRAYVLPVA